MSVIENVRLALTSRHEKRFTMYKFAEKYSIIDDAAKILLEDSSLWGVSNRRVNELSYGEQRQLEFVMALALRPRVLLLDEPTAGLSVNETNIIVNLVNRLDPNLTILIIEHDLDVALSVAERVIVFHHGEKINDGTAEEIREDQTVREIYLGGFGKTS